MGFRLPPLNTLRFFEAAGRFQSFKAVAMEMNVTPGAVSHAVRTLEEWLGVELILRTREGLMLTEAGSKFHPIVCTALEKLREATAKVPGRRGHSSLSISAAPSFAGSWLLPRLSRFKANFPDVTVSIDTARQQVDLPLDGVDLVIRMAPEPRPGGTWLRIAREVLVPVCAPSFAQEIAGRPWQEVLSSAPLIHVSTVTEDWSRYLDKVLPDARCAGAGSLRFDTIHMAVQAARQGFGITLGRRPVIDEELGNGHLVPVGAPPVQANTCYWLVGSVLTFDRPEVKAFRKWLLREIEISEADARAAGPHAAENGAKVASQ
ncbi:MAG: LysR substrate-binding domain-containing protein [Rhizobiaceae bacterium]